MHDILHLGRRHGRQDLLLHLGRHDASSCRRSSRGGGGRRCCGCVVAVGKRRRAGSRWGGGGRTERGWIVIGHDGLVGAVDGTRRDGHDRRSLGLSAGWTIAERGRQETGASSPQSIPRGRPETRAIWPTKQSRGLDRVESCPPPPPVSLSSLLRVVRPGRRCQANPQEVIVDGIGSALVVMRCRKVQAPGNPTLAPRVVGEVAPLIGLPLSEQGAPGEALAPYFSFTCF